MYGTNNNAFANGNATKTNAPQAAPPAAPATRKAVILNNNINATPTVTKTNFSNAGTKMEFDGTTSRPA